MFFLILCFLASCRPPQNESNSLPIPVKFDSPSLLILGTVQDAGSPQIGCKKECCTPLFANPDPKRKIVSLGLVDPRAEKKWLFEATPDIAAQMRFLHACTGFSREIPDGIFLTHAHIGHYAGLMQLGREAMNADRIPVYAMPRMSEYLQTNGPWSQLVRLKNIQLTALQEQQPVALGEKLSVFPFLVPHRDEYSETVGFQISGPNKKAIFIPDIDKWEKWKTQIEEAIAGVDYALLDATFFDGEELPGRNIAEIPHPFVSESLQRFATLPLAERNKIYFIHFNHTNPLLIEGSEAEKRVIEAGFHVARIGMVLPL
ncbi:MAG: MBL fold metallo-hydrolase [Bacteroidia bacterium]|nr:MBL fold metallo-hydrolase [Bacteroidia bacterium]